MEFKLENYKPLNYRTWALGGSSKIGHNLIRLDLLGESEKKLFLLSEAFQDQRNDSGHAEIVAYFTLKLLEYLPGKRSVAVPSAILHDIGYSGDKPNAWKELVNSGIVLDTEQIRRPHQNRGLLLGGRILEKAGYPMDLQNLNEIADIIGDHDTRKLETSENGRIVRAADLIWRVTLPHANIYFGDCAKESLLSRLEKPLSLLPPYNLEGIELQIARAEMVNTCSYMDIVDKNRTIAEKYPEELNLIHNYYSCK